MIQDSNRIAIISGERNITFSELLQRIQLYSLHTFCNEGDRTVIFAENREGWIFAFFSVWACQGIAVPVDASSTASDLAYILRDCKPEYIWTTHQREPLVKQAMQEADVTVELRYIEDFENVRVGEEKATITYQDDATALIIYTSGTTGSPKGVMLSFKNIMVNVDAVCREVPIITEDRRVLILLPLHHVLPLVGTVIMPILAGGGVAICPSMSGPDIMETLQRGKIAILIGVPRLWQTLYGGIKKKIDASAVTRFLFWLCSKVNSVKFSRLIFGAVHKKMGGHIRYFVSGGAALDREIALGLQTLGLELLEGYGMTEAAPMIAFTRPGDLVPGCVGLPLSCVEVKTIKGELCAKGPNVMQGYWNRPEETAAVIDKDGFLHTGDLGHLDEKGRIHITGRSKEIIVLSNGKNVQPAEIEYKLEKYTTRVKEAAVVQDGDMLRAIIVPAKEWADTLSDAEVEEVLKREVLEPYNLSVTNYKKLMSLLVYRGDLPRTKLEKLQRFKLKDILKAANESQKQGTSSNAEPVVNNESMTEEFRILKQYLEAEKKLNVRPTDHIETDLACDSLDMVALEGFILQTFGCEIKAGDMPSFHNIQAMADHIAQSKTRMEVEVEDWSEALKKPVDNLQLPSCSWMFKLISRTFKLFFRAYNHLLVRGVENIPAEGPFIIAPNHQSFLDGPIVTSGLSSWMLRNTYFYATDEHFSSPFRRAVANRSNTILMEMSNLRNSILKLAEVLRQGKNVVIFPEGARTHTGEMLTFKKTFAILAKELNIPIVPVVIDGAFEALPREARFVKPNKITVEYLEPILPEEDETYEELAERTKSCIEKVLKTTDRK